MQVGLIGSGNMARARDLVREPGGEALDSNIDVADRADLVVRPAFQDAFDGVIDWSR